MSGDRYELGRRRLLQATGAGIAGAVSLSTGVGAASSRSVQEAPDEDEFEEILSEMDGDGSESDPYTITDVVELQAMSGDVTAHYLLGNDIDASATAEWNDGAGFDPIAGREEESDDELTDDSTDEENDDELIDDSADEITDDELPDDTPDEDDESSETPLEFVGSLRGDDYEITGLTVDRPDELGTGLLMINQGLVFELTVTDATISGDSAGVIAASNGGGIGRVTVEGTVDGVDNVGGIVGVNDGQIVQSEAAVTVTGEDAVGGLVASNLHRIDQCVATGDVDGEYNVGGLVGVTSSAIEDSSAEGAVSGTRRVGGFVGEAGATITGCTATGDVTGESAVGGFAGESWGPLLGVTAEGSVEGDEHVGGLAGENYGEVRVCSSRGDVTGSSNVGGILGWGAAGTVVADSFSFGSVSGDTAVGALVGLLGWEFLNDGETAGVRRSYWNADATDAEPVGSLDAGDGEVVLEEESVEGLEQSQFVGEDVADHMTEFDFEQQWRPFPDDVPVPRAQTSSEFEIADISTREIVVSQDDTFDIEVEIVNTAEWDGTQTVVLVLNGEPIEGRDLTLAVGESEQVTFGNIPAADISVGNHTFSIQTRDDEVDGTIEVESASSAGGDDNGSSGTDEDVTPADGTTDDGNGADDDGAGFGIGAALTGVGTGAYLLARRFGGESAPEE